MISTLREEAHKMVPGIGAPVLGMAITASGVELGLSIVSLLVGILVGVLSAISISLSIRRKWREQKNPKPRKEHHK